MIQVKSPCLEKLSNMERSEKGFNCSVCEKEVVDFTKCTDEELILYFKGLKKGGTCGVYRQDQVILNVPVSRPILKHFYNRVFLLIAGIFSYSISKAQVLQNIKGDITLSPSDSSVKTIRIEETMDIIGVVVSAEDAKGLQVKKDEPLNGAPIKVKGSGKGTVTDLDGNFKLMNIAIGTIIEISYSGFKMREIKIETGKTEYNVSLRVNTEIFEEVIVVGYGTNKMRDITGLYGRRIDTSQNTYKINCVDQKMVGEPHKETRKKNFLKR